MWFYNSNSNRSHEKEDSREFNNYGREQHRRHVGSRDYSHEASEKTGQNREEVQKQRGDSFSPMREEVDNASEWFSRMIEGESRTQKSEPVNASLSNMIPGSAPVGEMISLYPALPDPTEETVASRATAEIVSRQIDGQGYWVTDEPVGVGLQTPVNMMQESGLNTMTANTVSSDTVG